MRTVARHPFGMSPAFEERPTVTIVNWMGRCTGGGNLGCNLWVRVNWERGAEGEGVKS
jgi:hypothetical protein